MTTQEQKLQKVVEAARECWHEISQDKKVFEDFYGFFEITYCVHCGKSWDLCLNKNPSPTDLNELFRLARKIWFTERKMLELAAHNHNNVAEALLNALYNTVGGSDGK